MATLIPSNPGNLPVPVSTAFQTSITAFSQPLGTFLAQLGLPTEKILSPIEERRRVIVALEDALSALPIAERAKATYLTKFTVATAVGLFDGALNYLWNETVNALRAQVAKLDLAYFFSVAEKINTRNKNLRSAEDLAYVDDHDLLEACRRIGFLSDVNYRRLEHINYMRNHVSAAHPNDNEISGYELLSWLANCLTYVITAVPDQAVISFQRLLENIRTEVIPARDFPIIGSEIVKLPQERIDDLLWALFGMYVDPRLGATVRTNISGVAPFVWRAGTEDRRYEIGARYGVFRKNADVSSTQAAEMFLQVVDGQRYKDEDSLAGELLEKLDMLKGAHFGMNNFYNEYTHAKVLMESLPVRGVVPRPARPLWVKMICVCYIGNGFGYREGVDERALPYYEQYIASFSDTEVAEFLHAMGDAEFTSAFDMPKAERRARQLATVLKTKTRNVHMQRALDLIIAAPALTLCGVFRTTAYKAAVFNVPRP